MSRPVLGGDAASLLRFVHSRRSRLLLTGGKCGFQNLALHLQETGLTWTEALTRKLRGNVLLAAPLINCAPEWGVPSANLDGVHDSVPHASWQAFSLSQVRSWQCFASIFALAHACMHALPECHSVPLANLEGVHDSVPHASWQAFSLSQVGSWLCLVSVFARTHSQSVTACLRPIWTVCTTACLTPPGRPLPLPGAQLPLLCCTTHARTHARTHAHTAVQTQHVPHSRDSVTGSVLCVF